MPYELEEYADDLYYRWYQVGGEINQVITWFDNLADAIAAENWGTAAFCCRAIGDHWGQVNYMLTDAYDSVRDFLDLSLYYINDNVPWDAGEVTYKSIVEAWFKDDFDGKAVTIACIDRMRQLLWDEPFDVIWAAKPEEREV